MQLGSIELPKSKWKALAACLERKLSGQTTFTEEAADVEKAASIAMQNYSVFKRKKNEKNRKKENSNFVKVDLNTVSTMKNRSLGLELIIHKVWNQLDMNEILQSNGFTKKQQTIAKAVIASRLISPSSELSTWKWLKNQTALTEIFCMDVDNIGKI